MKVVLILVHGTWGKKSSWMQESSKLCTTLRAGFGADAEIRRFAWSGRNSANARFRAARVLRSDIETSMAELPGVPHYVIGHSHGGNVALYALEACGLRHSISGVICLATPFLQARPRRLTLWNEVHVALCIFTALAFMVWVTYRIGHSGTAPSGLTISVCFALTFVAAYAASLLLSGWKKLSEEACNKFKVPTEFADKLLVFRMSGDEALAVLSTSHLIGWTFSRLFALLSLITIRITTLLASGQIRISKGTSWVENWTEKLFNIRIDYIWISFYFALLAVLLTLMGVDLLYTAAAVVAITSPLVVEMVIGYSELLTNLVAATFFVGIILPTALAISPFGPDLALTGPFIEISTDAIPFDVSCEVKSFVPLNRDALAHCTSYDDDRVLAEMILWIKARSYSNNT